MAADDDLTMSLMAGLGACPTDSAAEWLAPRGGVGVAANYPHVRVRPDGACELWEWDEGEGPGYRAWAPSTCELDALQCLYYWGRRVGNIMLTRTGRPGEAAATWQLNAFGGRLHVEGATIVSVLDQAMATAAGSPGAARPALGG